MVLTIGSRAIWIIGQKKAFYKQRILESKCNRKETVDKVILITSRNSERKVVRPIRRTSVLP